MFVRLNDGDEVIVKYNKANIIIVRDVEASDDFFVLWRRQSDMEYQLMWKGSYESCLKQFGDITGDMEYDPTIREPNWDWNSIR